VVNATDKPTHLAILHNIQNTQTAVASVSGKCKVMSVCHTRWASSKQVAGYRDLRTQRNSVACTHNCVCVCACYAATHLLTVIMALKHNSSDAGTASKPKRSHDVLSISEKVKIMDMIETGKKNCVRRLQVVWQERNFHL